MTQYEHDDWDEMEEADRLAETIFFFYEESSACNKYKFFDVPLTLGLKKQGLRTGETQRSIIHKINEAGHALDLDVISPFDMVQYLAPGCGCQRCSALQRFSKGDAELEEVLQLFRKVHDHFKPHLAFEDDEDCMRYYTEPFDIVWDEEDTPEEKPQEDGATGI